MYRYKVGNLIIKSEQLPVQFDKFLIDNLTEEDIEIVIETKPLIISDVVKKYDQINGYKISYLNGGLYSYSMVEHNAQMVVDKDYTLVRYYSADEEASVFFNLLSLPIKCKLISKGILTLHGSCVKVGDKAVSFSAPSGTGKSTRARAWIEAFNAEMISGDRPTIFVDQKSVFGPPWDGKEGIQHPELVTLKYICDIRRSPFTRVRNMTMNQKITFLSRQVFIPMWDPDIAMNTVLLIRKLAKNIPIVRLFCDMTKEAAVETFHILFESSNCFEEVRHDFKIKNGFIVRRINECYTVIEAAKKYKNDNSAYSLNEVSNFIFNNMKNFISKEDLIDLIIAEFDVERKRAAEDLTDMLQKLRDYGMIEE